MRKTVLAGAAIFITAAGVLGLPLLQGKAPLSNQSEFENQFDQRLYGTARDADITTDVEFVKTRLTGLLHLQEALSTDDALPAILKPDAADLRAHLDSYLMRTQEVLDRFAAGNERASNKAYRALEMDTAELAIAARKRERAIDDIFRKGLKRLYDNGIIYSEVEWEQAKRDLGLEIEDRDISPLVRAYLAQPTDNTQDNNLLRGLDTLQENEARLFFARLDYEIYHQKIRGFGSIASALRYGELLAETGQDPSAIRAVLEGPVTAILAQPQIDLPRYSDAIRAYLATLTDDESTQILAQIIDQLVTSAHARIADLEGNLGGAGSLTQAEPYVRAQFRLEAAKQLYAMGLAAEAIPFAEEALSIIADDVPSGFLSDEADTLLRSLQDAI